MVAKCRFCGGKIETDSIFVVEGPYLRRYGLAWSMLLDHGGSPENYGMMYHKRCYVKMLKEAELGGLRAPLKPVSMHGKQYLSEILEALILMGGKANSAEDLAKRLYSGKKPNTEAMIKLSENLRLLDAYGFVVEKTKRRGVSVEITKEGRRVIRLEEQAPGDQSDNSIQ